MSVELRLEMDVACFVAVEVQLDVGLDGAVLVEDSEGNLSLSDVDTLVAAVGVEDLDVHLVGEVGDVEFSVLVVPLGVLAAILGDLGVPLLVADAEVNEGVHLVEETALVVIEMGVLKVDVDVTVAGGGENNDDWH